MVLSTRLSCGQSRDTESSATRFCAAKPKPKFDYTAGGRYPDVFSDFRTFANLSQTFEDTGVAAYKGQAPNLMSNGLILTTALRIHSVEGRHAAEVRQVRGVRPWTGAFDRPDQVVPTRQYGTEARLGWVGTIVNLPSQTTLQNYGPEKMATIVSHQHPDHD